MSEKENHTANINNITMSARDQFNEAVDACSDINALSRVFPPLYRQASDEGKEALMSKLKEFLKTQTDF